MNAPIKFTWVSRILFLLFVLYWQVFTFFLNNQIISIGLIAIALIAQLAEDRFVLHGKTAVWLLAFALVALITSGLFAENLSIAEKYLIFFLEYVAMVYLIHRYSAMDGNVRFSAVAFVIVAVVMALVNLLFGGDEKRLTFSENLNVNAVGVCTMLGIGFLLLLFIRMKKNVWTVLLTFVLLLLLAFVTVKTVSRKAIIGAAILLAFWLLFCYGSSFKKQNVLVRILLFAVIIGGMVLAYRVFLSHETETVEYAVQRFENLDGHEGGSTQIRMELIREGWEVFLDHPLLGVGYNNYRFHNSFSTYAHNTYIELLCCTGLFGTMLFLAPLLQAAIDLIRRFIQDTKKRSVADAQERAENRMMLAFFGVLLFIGMTQIFCYELPLMYAYGVVTAYVISGQTQTNPQERNPLTGLAKQ